MSKTFKTNVDHQSKFNPSKYGKTWATIDFELAHGPKALHPIAPATQPIIGTLLIAGKRVEITFTESNKIMETLMDAQTQYNVAKRMGQLESGTGTYRG